MKQVCISFDEQNLKNLDYMLSVNLFPSFIKNRSQAINFLVQKSIEDKLEPWLDSYNGNFTK